MKKKKVRLETIDQIHLLNQKNALENSNMMAKWKGLDKITVIYLSFLSRSMQSNHFHKDGSSKSNPGLREKQNIHILNYFPRP
jgi:hypothetical protein